MPLLDTKVPRQRTYKRVPSQTEEEETAKESSGPDRTV